MPDDNKISDKFEFLKFKKEKAEQGVVEAGKENIPEAGFERGPDAIEPGASVESPDTHSVVGENLGESTHGIATIASLRKKREERQKKIEKIMSDDLADIYASLSPSEQEAFRKKGEETANEINTLMDKAKLKVKKVVNLIKKWLTMIPGVNKFFLEQEAKIKTDEIVKLKEDKFFD